MAVACQEKWLGTLLRLRMEWASARQATTVTHPGKRGHPPGQMRLEDSFQIARQHQLLNRIRTTPLLARVLTTISRGFSQASSARRHQVNRESLGRLVRETEAAGLLIRKGTSQNITWEATPPLLKALEANGGKERIFKPHHFRLEFRKSGEAVPQWRAGFTKEWIPRGTGNGHKNMSFLLDGQGNLPDVRLIVWKDSLEARLASRPHIVAMSEADALHLAQLQVRDAVFGWVDLQARYGGTVIVDPHYRVIYPGGIVHWGTPVKEDSPIGRMAGTRIRVGESEIVVDKSLPRETKQRELEVHAAPDRFDEIKAGEDVLGTLFQPGVAQALKKLPEAVSDMSALMAHVQGGALRDAQDRQKDAYLASVLRGVLDEQARVRGALEKVVNGNGRKRRRPAV